MFYDILFITIFIILGILLRMLRLLRTLYTLRTTIRVLIENKQTEDRENNVNI